MRKYLLALLVAFGLVVTAYTVNTSGKSASASQERCFLIQAGSRCINTP